MQMEPRYFDVPGDLAKPDELAIPKARDLAICLDADEIAFAKLVECRKNGKFEAVVFDLDVEVPQVRQHPMRPSERIAATFLGPDDAIAPIVDALREDFPRVPHLNLHLQEHPRNLCLYDERWEDIKRRWTPPRFVHDVRCWLALTSKGKLHQDDQPLEPILTEYVGHIVLTHDLQNADQGAARLFVTAARRDENRKIFVITQATPPPDGTANIVVSVHRCPPQTHGVIHRRPATLADLASMTASAGLDLIADLRERLKNWQANDKALIDSHLLLAILFPKKRQHEGEVETVDIWAFFLGDATREGERAGGDLRIRDVGVRIGLWDRQGNQVGLLLQPDTSRRGEDVGLDVLNVAYELDRSLAATLNGTTAEDEMRLAAVGVGALGSQLLMNLARTGFGRWTLIDHDRLMPHNVARHALGGVFVGWNKAEAVAVVANDILKGAELFTALPIDVLAPGSRADDLSKAFVEADAILDMSTSVSVARRLALDVDSPARRLSMFLTPSGRDLVLLVEDKERAFTLDALEMQYYRAILNDERLAGHLDEADGQHRYARSCRDITSTLPHRLVALHAALGARALPDALRAPEAAVVVWRTGEDGTVRRVDASLATVIRQNTGSWTVVTDEALIAKLSALRAPKLPNETGGVLVGSFDVERRVLYLVDALPSPPDSKEWPTLYIRGCDGLASTVETLTQKTHGMIEYVGEWHSHPEGASPTASHDDFEVFAWLGELMQADGLPAVMMIVGDGGCASCYVGQMSRERTALLGGHREEELAQLREPQRPLREEGPLRAGGALGAPAAPGLGRVWSALDGVGESRRSWRRARGDPGGRAFARRLGGRQPAAGDALAGLAARRTDEPVARSGRHVRIHAAEAALAPGHSVYPRARHPGSG